MFKSRESSLLKVEIDRAIRDMANHPVGTQDYVRTLDQVVKLHKMMEEEKSSLVSKDTLVVVGANLLGIIMIIKHEFVEIVSQRALSLVIRPRA